jgi:hypothetical protein
VRNSGDDTLGNLRALELAQRLGTALLLGLHKDTPQTLEFAGATSMQVHRR